MPEAVSARSVDGFFPGIDHTPWPRTSGGGTVVRIQICYHTESLKICMRNAVHGATNIWGQALGAEPSELSRHGIGLVTIKVLCMAWKAQAQRWMWNQQVHWLSLRIKEDDPGELAPGFEGASASLGFKLPRVGQQVNPETGLPFFESGTHVRIDCTKIGNYAAAVECAEGLTPPKTAHDLCTDQETAEECSFASPRFFKGSHTFCETYDYASIMQYGSPAFGTKKGKEDATADNMRIVRYMKPENYDEG
ncbi:hypothetical protein BCR34DRAFT_596738 [Clohesyomyces aquaticus]|uniref:Uncharacterized protein n=1 Tax=Clohesyomyces aquaticus TaxID=1231657 RepID=A0A1Y2A5S7_9PLEO|nr:hypothetical protein BCR34DRAFT_596738 [Clohesyomyces aquaticus]